MPTLSETKKNIIKIANKALKTKTLKIGDLTSPPNPDLGDLSLATFGLTKELKKNPVGIGKGIKAVLEKEKTISEISVTGPYVNIKLNSEKLAKTTLEEIAKEKNNFGKGKDLKGKKIMVEYAQPNPFKAFHIGHLRNVLLGEAVCKLFETQGAKVVRANYQGDVGMHIAKCLWAFQEVDPKDYPKSNDKRVTLIAQCYAQGAKAFEESKENQGAIEEINQEIYSKKNEKINQLWDLGKKWSLEKFHEIFDRLGTHFDREFMESEVMEEGTKQTGIALEKKILQNDDGAIIFKGERFDLDTRVFMNSQGLPTYEGKELGLAYKKFEEFGLIDLHIHVVAEEQISFFKVTFKVKELLDPGKFKDKQFHYVYGFVGLKSGKMSSRKGEVVLGQDIMNEAVKKIKGICKDRACSAKMPEKVGLGAIKYSFLKVDPKKYLAFDMDESVSFEGDSGPYLQYTYARIQSIFRKTKIEKEKIKFDAKDLTEPAEHKLVLELAKYPELIQKATDRKDPSLVAKYLFDLAQLFNDYYHALPILKAEENVKLARLALIDSVAQVLKNGLDILGIKTVDRM